MKELTVKIEVLERIKPLIYILKFKSAYIARNAEPGQFLHVKIDEKVTILRRPFSIHQIKGDTVYLLFKVRGRGTTVLSQYKAKDSLNIIGPLGKGFNYQGQRKDEGQILIGGGVGVAPLLFLAQKVKKLPATVLLGARDKNEILGVDEFKKLGYKVMVSTEDGSRGTKGTVIDLLKDFLGNRRGVRHKIYACGPKSMFYEIKNTLRDCPGTNCEVSFEQFMGCGIGVCCGCVIRTKEGFKKICKDGPVFNIRELA